MNMKSSLVYSTRNTHAVTMSIALQTIAGADIDRLESIALALEKGIKEQLLNQNDAKHLLGKVRLAIANRYFRLH